MNHRHRTLVVAGTMVGADTVVVQPQPQRGNPVLAWILGAIFGYGVGGGFFYGPRGVYKLLGKGRR